MKKVLALTLAVLMIVSVLPLSAMAAPVDFDLSDSGCDYYNLIEKTDYNLAPGAVESEIIINDDNQWECPACHNTDRAKMNVTRRTCGYLGENYWNVGKTKEIKSRVLHL